MTTSKHTPAGPGATQWHTGIAYAYGIIDKLVAEELQHTGIAPDLVGTHSGLAEYAALARVADHHVAEYVAHMRRNGVKSWAAIGEQIGVTAQAAQQRFGKLPPVPADTGGHKHEDCYLRLRRDRKGWGCKCGAVGSLD